METIGKYQIQRVLGRGGMGTVYQALDPLIQRTVALKTMAPGLADTPDLRERFLREARAAGGLKHRNIVTVYDLGEDKGRPFIAMEYVEGTDLEKIIQNRQPYPLEWKLGVLAQICEGLAYAHRNGIVHRDVKPANIRVTADGEVKIMDFGIAHLQSSTMTRSGLILGTVHYMAPEQVEGHKVDHRADIFAVGAIAYELIAYRRPFEDDSMTGVMYKVMHEPPDPRGLPENEYPAALRGVVMKALEKRLEDRYQSLDEMNADIQGLLRSGTAAVESPFASRAGPDLAEATVEFPVEKGPEARALQRETEAEELRQRVEREMGEIRAEAARARAEGQLQRALGLWRRLLEVSPEDGEAIRAAAEIEQGIQDRELEQLSSMALSYAADGDMELALKIAGKMEKLAPGHQKTAALRTYLEEEASRRQADALVASAQEHLAIGNLEEARAAAAEALAVVPTHAIAREIHQRASQILKVRSVRARADVPPSKAEQPAPSSANPALAAVKPAVPPPPLAAVPGGGGPRPLAPPRARVSAPSPLVTNPRPPVVPRLERSTTAVATPVAQPEMPAPPEAAKPPAVALAAAMPPAPSATLPAGPTTPAVAPTVAPSPAPESAQLTPLPEGPPSHPKAVELLDAARRLLRERATQRALPLLEEAKQLEPSHQGIERLVTLTRIEARRAEAESLTTAALNHFLQNNYVKARKAVDKALALEPENKKAKELVKILGTLS